MDNLKSKSIKAFLWDFSGKILGQIIALVVSIILARILAPKEFGLIAIVNVFIGLSNIFMDVGLGAALIQRKKLLPIHYSSVFYFNILLSSLVAIVIFFLADYISVFYNQSILKPLIQFMSLSFVINSLGVIPKIKLQKQLNLRLMNTLQIVAVIISGLISIYLACNGYGVWSLLIQILSNQIIFTSLLWIFVRWTPGFIFSLKALKQLFTFGFSVFLSNVINAIFNKIDVIIIGKIFSINTLGFFQKGKALSNQLLTLSSQSLNRVLFPVLSTVQNEKERFKSIVNKLFKTVSFLIFLLFGMIYLCADNIILILFTEKWSDSIVVFKMLVLAGLIYPFNSIALSVIMSKGKSKKVLKLNIIKKVPKVILLMFGFYFGLNGYLYGLVLVSVINTFINFQYVKKELEVSIIWLYRPIMNSLSISILTVSIMLYLVYYFDFENQIIILLFKMSGYLILYLTTSIIFKIEGLRIVKDLVFSSVKRG